MIVSPVCDVSDSGDAGLWPWPGQGHNPSLHYTKLSYNILHYNTLKYTTLNNTTHCKFIEQQKIHCNLEGAA